MIKVLAYGDAGWRTGFERVLRGVMDHLHSTGEFEIVVMGLGYQGNPDMPYNYKVYPASVEGDSMGSLGLKEAVKKHRPDVLWMVQDLWNLTTYMAHKPIELPSVCYFPVDTPNLKWGYGLSLGSMTYPVAYTKFGATEAAASARDAIDVLIEGAKAADKSLTDLRTAINMPHPDGVKIHVPLYQLGRMQNLENWQIIPHGLDRTKFEPRDKATCRELFGIPGDAFVVMNVNTNQFRKRLDLTFRVFAEFANTHPNARLVLHCAGSSERGWDLQQLARYSGVVGKVHLIHELVPELSEDDLVSLYNTADVMINTAGGEGWGLCLGPDTLIDTLRGPVLIPEVRVGDRVLTETGTFAPVIGTTRRTVDSWYHVKVKGQEPLKVTAEHPFFSVSGDLFEHPELADRAQWTRVGDIQVGDFVALGQLNTTRQIPDTVDLADLLPDWEADGDSIWHPMGFTPRNGTTSITSVMRKLGETKKVVEKAFAVYKGRRSVASTRVGNVVEYLEGTQAVMCSPKKYTRLIRLTDDLLEVLGWYLAEGSDDEASVEFSLGGTEHKEAQFIVDTIKERFGVEGSWVYEAGASPHSKIRVSVNGVPIVRFFTLLCGRGAYNKRVAETLPLEDPRMRFVWRGYASGDGHRTPQGGLTVSTVSRVLAHQMQLSLRAQGIASRIQKTVRPASGAVKGGTIYHVGLGTFAACRLYGEERQMRHTPNVVFAAGKVWARVTQCEQEQGELEVYDLAVLGTHSFVGNSVLVHNTAFEGAACGIPQMVPDWSATRELWTGYGMLLPVADWRLEPKFLNTAHANIDVRRSADMLRELAANDDLRKELSAKALENAAKQPTWTEVGTRFQDLLVKAVNAPKDPVPVSLLDLITMRTGDVRSELQGKTYLPLAA